MCINPSKARRRVIIRSKIPHSFSVLLKDPSEIKDVKEGATQVQDGRDGHGGVGARGRPPPPHLTVNKALIHIWPTSYQKLFCFGHPRAFGATRRTKTLTHGRFSRRYAGVEEPYWRAGTGRLRDGWAVYGGASRAERPGEERQ